MPMVRFGWLLLLVLSWSVLGLDRRVFGASDDNRPEWTYRQSRSVIGGDILHLGIGLGKSPELARFKAEAMAVRNLISECSLAHREIAIWDRYLERSEEGEFRAYARAGLSFTACNEARASKGNGRVALSNPELVKNQDLYDRLEFEAAQSDRVLNQLRIWILTRLSESEGRIAKWVRSRLAGTDDRLRDVEHRISTLESAPKQSVTVVQQQTYVLGASAGNELRFRDCMAEYEELMREANARAMSANPPGNLASPEAAPAWNRAERKLAYCRTIKR